MSVRANMGAPCLAGYYQHRTSNRFYDRPIPHSYPFAQLRQPWHLQATRTMPMMQSSDAAHFGQQLAENSNQQHANNFGNVFYAGETAGYGSFGTPVSFFDDQFHYPQEQDTLGDVAFAPQWREFSGQPDYSDISLHPSMNMSGFAGASGSSFGGSFNGSEIMAGPSDDLISKSDSGPHQPIQTAAPAQLSLNIPTHGHGVLAQPPVDNETPSPSSVDSLSNGPATPPNVSADNSFSGALGDTQVPRFGSYGVKVEDPSTNEWPLTSTQYSRSMSAGPGTHNGLLQHETFQNDRLSRDWRTDRPQRLFQPEAAAAHQAHGHIPATDLAVADLTRWSQQAGQTSSAPQTSSRPVTPSLLEFERRRSAMETTPESSDSDSEDMDGEPDINEQAVSEAAHRRDRDRYLLKMREKGYSYREIKRLGRFKEAESTLRGRIRVLTKDKSERVRKPEWTAADIDLLNRAVERYVDISSLGDASLRDGHGKVPWKKISFWMRNYGSTYMFAPATCAKKWRELN